MAEPSGPVEVGVGRLPERRVCISQPEGATGAVGDELAVFAGTEPLARGSFAGVVDGRPTFALDSDLRSHEAALRWFVIGRDVAASSIRLWPDQATLQAEVDSVGPGGRSAWVTAGSDDGIAVGDSWWLRVGGQPTARCDVVHVAARACFCAVVPLASTPTLLPGVRVALWPAPAERRDERASSAVAYAESRSDTALVWIAAPADILCPPDPHVDFYRAAQYIGHGLVERRDDRFWYVRLTTAAGAHAAVETGAPRVGDEAVIRTQADIDRRRFSVRVFEVTPPGALLSAGEADALAVGDRLTVYRDKVAAGEVLVREVHRTYAVATPADQPGPLVLRVGDELRLRPPPPAPRSLGSIQRVVAGILFSARLTTGAAPLGVPLPVQAAGRTVGVAMLVTVDETGRAGGFVFAGSLTQPLTAGMELLSTAEPTTGPTSGPAAPTGTAPSSGSSRTD